MKLKTANFSRAIGQPACAVSCRLALLPALASAAKARCEIETVSVIGSGESRQVHPALE